MVINALGGRHTQAHILTCEPIQFQETMAGACQAALETLASL